MAAAHVKIAREDGPKAGFNAWKEQMRRSGLPQVKARLAEVEAQGNKKAQFDYYCAQYGKQIFGTGNNPAPVTATPATPSAGDLFAQFQAFLESQGGTPATTDEDDSLDDVDEETIAQQYTRSSGGTTKRSTARSTTSADPAEAFKPRDPDAIATSGRLWRLNEAGLLKVVNKAGTPVTNGQAHEILKSILS